LTCFAKFGAQRDVAVLYISRSSIQV
jgi:hypothetical protein